MMSTKSSPLKVAYSPVPLFFIAIFLCFNKYRLHQNPTETTVLVNLPQMHLSDHFIPFGSNVLLLFPLTGDPDSVVFTVELVRHGVNLGITINGRSWGFSLRVGQLQIEQLTQGFLRLKFYSLLQKNWSCLKKCITGGPASKSADHFQGHSVADPGFESRGGVEF